MTQPDATETQPPSTPIRVPGVASTAIHGLLTGSGTQARILGTSSHAMWLEADDRVIVITIGDGPRLPNGIHLPRGPGEHIVRNTHKDAKALVGHGRVMLEGASVTIGRWWDPRPGLTPVTAEQLAVNLDDLPGDVPEIDTAPLQRALEVRSAGGVLHSARSLLGKGPGLTPEGDDVLIGALSATRLLGEATGREGTVAFIAGVSMPLAQLADIRTTAFSSALLRMALRGQVIDSVGALLRALAGRGDIAASHLELTRLGHTSGPAMAAGIVLAARALIK